MDHHFESIIAKARFAQVLLGVTAAYWGIQAYFSYGVSTDLDNLDSELADFAVSLENLYPIGLLATAVAFVIWSYSAHASLRYLDRPAIYHQDQATIWWWIVPFAFLWMPFKVIYETTRGSIAPIDSAGWRKEKIPDVAGWWTGFFLVGIVATRGVTSALDQIRLEDLGNLIVWYALGSGALVAAAIAAINMIELITVTQTARAREFHEARAGAPVETDDDRVLPVPAQPTPDSSFCSSCGTVLNADDRFCRGCGTRVGLT